MKLLTAIVLTLGAATSIVASDDSVLEIVRHGSQPPEKAAAANFTGAVQLPARWWTAYHRRACKTYHSRRIPAALTV